MLIETLCNRTFCVRDAGPGLDHRFLGVEQKRSAGGFVPKKNAREILVRKTRARVIERVA